MANQAIVAAVQQLKQEHIRLCKELARVDEALSVLGSLDTSADVPAKNGKVAKVAKKAKSVTSTSTTEPKRKISPAARKKMSEAARARWAVRKGEKAPSK